MEGTMDNLAGKMIDMVTSMQDIGKAVSTLAVVDVKITDLDKSIGRVADAHRALSNRVDLLQNEASVKCTTTLDKAEDNGWRRFMLATGSMVTLMGVDFGYLYLDVKAERKEHTNVVTEIHKLQNTATKTSMQMQTLKENIKKANGHRYYIQVKNLKAIEDLKDTITVDKQQESVYNPSN